MRKNIQRVFAAWRGGHRLNLGSISTDGEMIKSYNTPILFWQTLEDGNKHLILNMERYSATTSLQQNGLYFLLGQWDFAFVKRGGKEPLKKYDQEELIGAGDQP